MNSVDEIFAFLAEAVADSRGTEIVEKIGGVYGFRILSERAGEQHWVVDLSKGGEGIRRGTGKTQCNITIKDEDFCALLGGRLGGREAFLSGKLKVQGDHKLALKLSSLAKFLPRSKPGVSGKEFTHKYIAHVVVAQSCVRRYLARQARLSREKRSVRRRHIVGEMVATERSYIGALHTFMERFIRPLESAQGILNPHDLTQLISNLDFITTFNATLLADLEAKFNRWTPASTVGDVFARLTPFMRAYASYIANYSSRRAKFEKLQETNADFAHFLHSLRANHPELLSFDSYMIQPVQRIPRYRMLLEDLLTATWPEHADYGPLCTSLRLVNTVADEVENSVGELERRDAVVALHHRFAASSGVDLMGPARKLMFEGVLLRVTMLHSLVGPSWLGTASVHVYVFSDLIMLCAKSLFSFRYWMHCPLHACFVVDLPAATLAHAFQLRLVPALPDALRASSAPSLVAPGAPLAEAAGSPPLPSSSPLVAPASAPAVAAPITHTLLCVDAADKERWLSALRRSIDVLVANSPALRSERELISGGSAKVAPPTSADDARRIVLESLTSECGDKRLSNVLQGPPLSVAERRALFERGLLASPESADGPDAGTSSAALQELLAIEKGIARSKRDYFEAVGAAAPSSPSSLALASAVASPSSPAASPAHLRRGLGAAGAAVVPASERAPVSARTMSKQYEEQVLRVRADLAAAKDRGRSPSLGHRADSPGATRPLHDAADATRPLLSPRDTAETSPLVPRAGGAVSRSADAAGCCAVCVLL